MNLPRILRTIGQAGGFAACLGWATLASAQNGTWTGAPVVPVAAPDPGNLWSNSANWAGGVVADGATGIADFSVFDPDSTWISPVNRNPVQFDLPRSLNGIVFGDANTATPGGWDIFTNDAAVNILTLDGTSPTITVNNLASFTDGVTTYDDAVIRPTVAAAAGFTKSGPGILTLAGANQNLHGTVTVAQGTLRAASTATFDYETAIDAARTQFHLAGGATLEAATSIGQNAAAGPGTSIAPGATATLRKTGTGSLFYANVGGLGSTLNFESTGGTASVDRDWNAGGALARINFIGTTVGTPSTFRIRNNGGTFNANSFATTVVNIDNAVVFTNTNSGGNTNTFGALSGTATGTLQGGAAGSVVTYVIGGLNTNTTFAGNMTTGTGLNLFKVGTGTLELSGTLSYQPTTNGTLNRRGGITRVEVGTLKLSGAAAISGGLDAATPSTVDVRAAGTLDVGSTTTPYSTSIFQQVIGAGTIAGNYIHDEGLLAPGDTNVGGNTQTITSVAGTLTFANNLNITGGTINFDVSPSLVSGNDLIQVGGGDLSGSATVNIGFLGGASTGQYTVINSATPLTGTVAGWIVNWTGRGAAPGLVQTANQVKLDASSVVVGNVNWSGGVNGLWDAGSGGTSNWHNTGTNAADKYFQLDNVRFLDTSDGVAAPVTTTVTLSQTVSPSSVLVNSALDYSISGTGLISGGTGLTKQGTGKLTLTTANTYGGGTTISGGIVALGNTGRLGGGTVTLAGGQVSAGESATFNLDNAIVVNGAGNAISNTNNASQTLNINGVITGSGALAIRNDSVGDTVNMTPPVVNGVDLFGANTGFTGSLSMDGPTAVFARYRSAASAGTNVALNLGNNGSTMAANIGANTTITLGSLAGGALSTLSGHESSGGAGSTTYRVGTLNTSTTMDGIIKDGRVDLNPASFTALTKVGTGSLTLTGLNTYTGETRVEGGTLSMSQATLADLSDIFISTGALLDLTHGATDVIDSLYLGGVPQAIGTYGAAGSGAMFTSAFFSGTGILSVTTLGASLGIAGDYNGNGTVDAADYTSWRDAVGTTTVLMNDPIGGTIGAAQYTQWVTNFGQPAGASVAAASAVPEPASCVLALGLVLALRGFVRRK